MNDCCKHLFMEAKKELEIKDKRIAFLESETTRLFDPTRQFWNEQNGKKIAELKALVMELAEACEYYANPINFYADDYEGGGFHLISVDDQEDLEVTIPELGDTSPDFYYDVGGKRSRQVLSKNKELIEAIKGE